MKRLIIPLCCLALLCLTVWWVDHTQSINRTLAASEDFDMGPLQDEANFYRLGI